MRLFAKSQKHEIISLEKKTVLFNSIFPDNHILKVHTSRSNSIYSILFGKFIKTNICHKKKQSKKTFLGRGMNYKYRFRSQVCFEDSKGLHSL